MAPQRAEPNKRRNKNPRSNSLGHTMPCKQCGGTRLTLGHVTLHFEPKELEALYRLVKHARTAMREQQDKKAVPAIDEYLH